MINLLYTKEQFTKKQFTKEQFTKEQFTKELLRGLKSLGASCEPPIHIEQVPVAVNNQIIREKIQFIQPNNPISKMVDVEMFYDIYQSGVQFEDILQEFYMLGINQNPAALNELSDQLQDYNYVKKHLTAVLVNAKANEALSQTYVTIPFLDLFILIRFVISSEDHKMFGCYVNLEMTKDWGITKKQLFEDALTSMYELFPPVFTNLNNIVKEMPMWDSCLYMVSNSRAYYGAGSILYTWFLKDIADELQGDFYLLPCSVHEMIAIPVKEITDVQELHKMVCEVNRSEVSEEEYLSDNVYLYKRHTMLLEIV